MRPVVRYLVLSAAPLLAADRAGSQAAPSPRPTVAVMSINNASLVQHGDYEQIGRGLVDILITELQQNPSIDVVDREHIRRVMEEQDLDSTGRVSPETAVRIGRILGAQYMLFGGFVVDGRGRMRLDLRAVNVETTRIEYVVSKSRNASDMLELVEELAAEVNRSMRLPPLGARVRPAVGPQAPDSSRFRAMVLYSRGVEEQDRGNTQQAVLLFEAALQRNPQHDRARLRLEQLKPRGG